jgi:hypothetical protein
MFTFVYTPNETVVFKFMPNKWAENSNSYLKNLL